MDWADFYSVIPVFAVVSFVIIAVGVWVMYIISFNQRFQELDDKVGQLTEKLAATTPPESEPEPEPEPELEPSNSKAPLTTIAKSIYRLDMTFEVEGQGTFQNETD